MRYAIDVVAHWSRAYGARAQLALVYIQEAHAQDEWPISSCRLAKVPRVEAAGGGAAGVGAAGGGAGGGAAHGAPIIIKQQRSIEDRLAAARDFVRDYALPLQPEGDAAAPGVLVVADEIGNSFQDLVSPSNTAPNLLCLRAHTLTMNRVPLRAPQTPDLHNLPTPISSTPRGRCAGSSSA
jgi:hypothetical protein